jgi:hypothetical protein
MLSGMDEAVERSRVEFPVYGKEGGEPLVDVSPAGLKRLLEEDDIERYGRGGTG